MHPATEDAGLPAAQRQDRIDMAKAALDPEQRADSSPKVQLTPADQRQGRIDKQPAPEDTGMPSGQRQGRIDTAKAALNPEQRADLSAKDQLTPAGQRQGRIDMQPAAEDTGMPAGQRQDRIDRQRAPDDTGWTGMKRNRVHQHIAAGGQHSEVQAIVLAAGQHQGRMAMPLMSGGTSMQTQDDEGKKDSPPQNSDTEGELSHLHADAAQRKKRKRPKKKSNALDSTDPAPEAPINVHLVEAPAKPRKNRAPRKQTPTYRFKPAKLECRPSRSDA